MNTEFVIKNVVWGMSKESEITYRKKINAWVNYANQNGINATHPTFEDVKTYLSRFEQGSSAISVRTILAKFFHEVSKETQNTHLLDLIAKMKDKNLLDLSGV